MDSDTPNIHTPPEGHAPPPPPPHHGHDGEQGHHEFEHHHDECKDKHHLCERAHHLCDHAHHACEHAHHLCQHSHHEEPPLVILDRRFAEGKITKEEYLESKELLVKNN